MLMIIEVVKRYHITTHYDYPAKVLLSSIEFCPCFDSDKEKLIVLLNQFQC